MKIKAVLFDLDGTLLPMRLSDLWQAFCSAAVKSLSPYGYDREKLTLTLRAGIDAMTANDGSCTCEERFFRVFEEAFGVTREEARERLYGFYENDFAEVRRVCGYNPKAREILDLLHERGVRTILATSPLFPIAATRQRIGWAGLSTDDFELITTFSDMCYAKPNTKFYTELAKRIGLAPEECLMVGNDVFDDMPARTVGMQVFLLTDTMENRLGEDISQFPNGSFEQLRDYIEKSVLN